MQTKRLVAPTISAALTLSIFAFDANAVAQPAAGPFPADAKVYFITPKDGDVITGKVTVVMGLKGMGIAPAGVEKEKTGHHHILVDVDLPKGDDLDYPLQLDDNHRHFGGGQTETVLDLKPGQHTLQLVIGDNNHIPHKTPVASEKITITVK